MAVSEGGPEEAGSAVDLGATTVGTPGLYGVPGASSVTVHLFQYIPLTVSLSLAPWDTHSAPPLTPLT